MKKIILTTACALFAVTVAFTGCGSKKQEQVEAATYVNPELQGAPKWVMMPFVEGSVSEVGSAPQNAGNDFSFQREEAMADARDNVAKQISVKVNNMFKSYKAATGSGKDSTFDRSSERVSKQIASQTLNGTIVKDTWISRSGTFYVLMAVETKSVSDMMEKSVKTSFKNDKAMYQKFLAHKAQGELDKELEKFNQ